MPNKVIAGDTHHWIEVKSTQNGRQWWDQNSLEKTNDNLISILSRYEPRKSFDNESYQEISYNMIIDCSKRLYKDKSVNGIKQKVEKWNTPHGDSLIDETIKSACSH
ncbi:hypothetical protein [Prochlorococcus marinus]|uniref:hypothetical protein n=1 Tax=Prochlorococcus marinus TaxID=1219 RepID=UPI0022B52696|nr:hypothetical protein [Prochlorococcus marinus]